MSQEVGKGNIICVSEIHPWRKIRMEREEGVGYPCDEVEDPSDRASKGIDNLLKIINT